MRPELIIPYHSAKRYNVFQNGGEKMDANKRLRELLDERGWTYYRLAKNSGLSESTLANIFLRGTIPSLSTLEIMCRGFGITLAQFFSDGDDLPLTREAREMLDTWGSLSPDKRTVLLQLAKTLQNQ